MNSRELNDQLAKNGLCVLGGFVLSDRDALGAYGSLALIGPQEPAFWSVFTDSHEFGDGMPDAMDRWSTRVLADVAANHNAKPLFPFGGAPFHPFYTWALRSGMFWASPIGFLVHAQAGLFASFRGALLLPDVLDFETAAKPCDTCPDKPCKTACPVAAFDDGYNVAVCKSHLNTDKGRDCMSGGCLSRRACPIGANRRLPAQSSFHMKAFR